MNGRNNPDLLDEDDQQLQTMEPQPETLPVAQATSPLDLPADVFSAGLERRGTNRKALMEWVRDSLVDGVDMGGIMIGGRMSKPSLRKPGAEKICGMLGLTATFPTLPDYEKRVLEGGKIEDIILRCHLIDGQGNIVADGVGARSVSADNGDLNKALKMSEKSAMIDATLRCAGLSEIFTQDIEDMKFDQDTGAIGPNPEKCCTFGKNKGTLWEDMNANQLEWYITGSHDASSRKGAQSALDALQGIETEVPYE